MLMEHDWPGNIRELQNVVERAMNYAYEGTLAPSHFHFFYPTSMTQERNTAILFSERPQPVRDFTSVVPPRQKAERELILKALLRML